jgi:hypothetical protein
MARAAISRTGGRIAQTRLRWPTMKCASMYGEKAYRPPATIRDVQRCVHGTSAAAISRPEIAGPSIIATLYAATGPTVTVTGSISAAMTVTGMFHMALMPMGACT